MDHTYGDPRQDVEILRAFNRCWTRQAGLLRAGLLETPYSLVEARVIFDVAQRGPVELADLRRTLGIDAGYATRVVQRLCDAGVLSTSPSPTDARRKILELTDAGHRAFGDLDERADAQAASLLDRFDPDARSRLVAAMRTIRDAIDPPDTTSEPYLLRGPEPGDLGWVVQRHGVLYAQEYGWNAEFEALVARIVGAYLEDHDPARENAWITERHGAPVGSIFCTRRDEVTAQLRLLLVEPSARGMGIGARLVGECIRFARRAGYSRMTLWTNDVLTAARRIYESHGFELTDEHAHRSFGHDLVGQHWSLDLDSSDDPTRPTDAPRSHSSAEVPDGTPVGGAGRRRIGA